MLVAAWLLYTWQKRMYGHSELLRLLCSSLQLDFWLLLVHKSKLLQEAVIAQKPQALRWWLFSDHHCIFLAWYISRPKARNTRTAWVWNGSISLVVFSVSTVCEHVCVVGCISSWKFPAEKRFINRATWCHLLVEPGFELWVMKLIHK